MDARDKPGHDESSGLADWPSVNLDPHAAAAVAFEGDAWNNTLLYLKGGAALTSDRYRGYLTATGMQSSNVVDDTRWGGLIGVGLEYGFAPNWSAGVEYTHMFMQDRFIAFTNSGTLAPAGTAYAYDRIHQDVDLITVRVNYRWGGAVVAKY